MASLVVSCSQQPDHAVAGQVSPAVPNTHGFSCEFVEKPPKAIQSECPVCLQILREPYQAPCCGNSFCRVCIERIKTDNKPCPTCNEQNFVIFHNKGLQRSLYEFQVYCSNKQEGCEWKGELGQLDNHINLSPQPDKQLEGCEYSEIECNCCSELIKRGIITVHQTEQCFKRPFSCEYCHSYESTYEDIFYNHWPVVCGYYPVECPNKCGTFPQHQALENHVTKDCPETVIDCDFHHVGCNVKLPRKDMPAHLNENLVTHMSLQATHQSGMLATLQNRVNKLEDENKTLKQQMEEHIDTLKAASEKNQQMEQEIALLKAASEKNQQMEQEIALLKAASEKNQQMEQEMKAASEKNQQALHFDFSKEIKFYNRDEPYYEFTNFYPVTVTIDGARWPTTEHYFQAQKFIGTPYVEIIRKLPAPRAAFQLSRDPKVSQWRRSDWDSVKDDVMHKALQCKFDQHPNLRRKLLDTGNKRLIEHTSNDSYWGDGGGEGRGQNKLGQLLMKVREELKVRYGSQKKKNDNHEVFKQLESTLNPGETSRSVRGMASPITSRKNFNQSSVKRSVSFASGVDPSTSSHSSTHQSSHESSSDDIAVTSSHLYRPSQTSGRLRRSSSLGTLRPTQVSNTTSSHSSHMTPHSSHVTSHSSHKTVPSPHNSSKHRHKTLSSSDDSTLKEGERPPGRSRLKRRSYSLENLHGTTKSSARAGSHKVTPSRTKPPASPAPSTSSLQTWSHGTPPKQSKTSSSFRQLTLKQTLYQPAPSISSRSQTSRSNKPSDSSVPYDIITHQYKITRV